jgi:hypothetical protein
MIVGKILPLMDRPGQGVAGADIELDDGHRVDPQARRGRGLLRPGREERRHSGLVQPEAVCRNIEALAQAFAHFLWQLPRRPAFDVLLQIGVVAAQRLRDRGKVGLVIGDQLEQQGAGRVEDHAVSF